MNSSCKSFTNIRLLAIVLIRTDPRWKYYVIGQIHNEYSSYCFTYYTISHKIDMNIHLRSIAWTVQKHIMQKTTFLTHWIFFNWKYVVILAWNKYLYQLPKQIYPNSLRILHYFCVHLEWHVSCWNIDLNEHLEILWQRMWILTINAVTYSECISWHLTCEHLICSQFCRQYCIVCVDPV